ncbi:hypothetical protein KIL84_020399, partial [Mauremys mutica]
NTGGPWTYDTTVPYNCIVSRNVGTWNSNLLHCGTKRHKLETYSSFLLLMTGFLLDPVYKIPKVENNPSSSAL